MMAGCATVLAAREAEGVAEIKDAVSVSGMRREQRFRGLHSKGQRG